MNGIIKGISEKETKSQKKKLNKALFNIFMNNFLDINNDTILVCYYEMINGIINTVIEAEDSNSKNLFIKTMMDITLEAFEKIKKESDKNES